MKKKTLITFLFFLSLFHVYGQGQTNYMKTITFTSTPPAPQTTEMTRFGGIPVSYATGAPSVAVPLHSTTLKNGLSVNISLNYQSNGIQVRDRGGLSGLGWSLIAGGAITRTVNDEPDDYDEQDANIFTKAYLAGQIDYGQPYLNNLLKQTINRSGTDGSDLQPDLFSYNFMGHSGQFFIDSGKAYIIKYEDLKIEMQFSALDPWNFRITDQAGNIFLFGGPGCTESTNTVSSGNLSTGGLASSSQNATSGWNLQQIISPLGDTVAFSYTGASYQFTASKEINHFISQTTISDNGLGCGCAPYQLDATTNVSGLQNFLSAITVNHSQKATFSYDAHPDILGGQIISGIQVRDLIRNEDIKHITFHYLNTVNKRVFLDSIAICDGNAGQCQNYGFKYLNPTTLPIRMSDNYDKWGFYSTSPPDVNCDNTKAGMLCEIRYPTGGRDSLEYTCNGRYELVPHRIPHYSGSIQGTGYGDHEPNIYTLDFVMPANAEEWQVYAQADYNSTFPPDPYFDRIRIYVKNKSTNADLINNNFVDIPGNTFQIINIDSSNVQPGDTLELQMWSFGQLTAGTSMFRYQAVSTSNEWVNYGGVALSKAITSDPFNNTQQVKKYVYGFYADGSPSYTLCVPVENEKDFRFENACPFPESLWGDAPEVGYHICETKLRTDNNLISLYNHLPGPFLYRSVLEYLGENGEYGLNEYLFNINQPTPGELLFQNSLMSLPGTYNYNCPYSLGMSDITQLNTINNYRYAAGSYNLVKSKKFHYTNFDLKDKYGYSAYVVSARDATIYYEDTHVFGDLWRFIFRSSVQVVDTETETTFNEYAAQTIKKDFQYRNRTATLPNIVHTSVNGDAAEEYYDLALYPEDYVPNGDFIQSLVARHQTGLPVEQLSIVSRSGSLFVRDGAFNEYNNNGALKKRYALALQSAVPYSGFKISDRSANSPLMGFTKTAADKSPDYKKFIEHQVLDEKYNPVQSVNDAGRQMSYLYSYDKQYLIAATTNSDQDNFAYTSFEDDNQHGGWSYSAVIGNGISQDNAAPTGYYVMNPGATLTKSGLSASARYRIEFYYKGTAAPSVSGLVGSQSGPEQAGGYIHFEGLVTGVNMVSISIPAGCYLDELRLYPENGSMATSAYRTGAGIISGCDEKGQITHYEYDGMGRLTDIKDGQGNIVKQFKYQIHGSL